MNSRLAFLLHGPALATRVGCRARVRALSLGDWMRLQQHFGCSVEEFDRRLHDRNHKKRTKRTERKKGT